MFFILQCATPKALQFTNVQLPQTIAPVLSLSCSKILHFNRCVQTSTSTEYYEPSETTTIKNAPTHKVTKTSKVGERRKGRKDYLRKIYNYSEQKRFLPILKLFREMEQIPKLKPETLHYNVLLGTTNKALRFDKTLSYYGGMKTRNIAPDIVTFTHVLKALLAENKVALAKELISKMKKDGIDPSVKTYGVFITHYSKKGKFQEAIEVMDDMLVKDGVKPDLFMYTNMIQGYDIKGDWRQGFQLYKLLVRNSKSTFANIDIHGPVDKKDPKIHDDPDFMMFCSATIRMLVNHGNWKEAVRVLQDMSARNVEPDATTYNSLMKGLGSDGRVEMAEKMYNTMQEKGIQPNLTTYNILLDIYSDTEDFQRCQELMGEIKKLNIKCNSQTYSIYLRALAENLECEEIFKTLDEVKSKKISLSVIFTFNSMFRPLCRHQKWKAVGEIIEKMKDFNTSPDIISYTHFIIGLGEAEKWQAALDVLKTMEKEGVKPNKFTYKHVLTVLGNCGQWSRALTLFEEMKFEKNLGEACLTTYRSLIAGLAKNYRWQESADAYITMTREDKIRPDLAICKLVLQSLPMSEYTLAAQIYQDICKNKIGVDEELATTLKNAFGIDAPLTQNFDKSESDTTK